jgi:hypothetical protein
LGLLKPLAELEFQTKEHKDYPSLTELQLERVDCIKKVLSRLIGQDVFEKSITALLTA